MQRAHDVQRLFPSKRKNKVNLSKKQTDKYKAARKERGRKERKKSPLIEEDDKNPKVTKKERNSLQLYSKNKIRVYIVNCDGA